MISVDTMELSDEELIAILASVSSTVAVILKSVTMSNQNRIGCKYVKREKKTAQNIFSSLTDREIKKAYRMSASSFWKLRHLLFKNPLHKCNKRGVTQSMSLSIALRWFAGGNPTDIAIVHGVCYDEVLKNVWKVVDQVNECDELKFSFPDNHEEQQKIAEEFKKKITG